MVELAPYRGTLHKMWVNKKTRKFLPGRHKSSFLDKKATNAALPPDPVFYSFFL
jgi:hypothetical protein